MTHLRERIKAQAGRAAGIAPQARFDRGILVLSHMRAATTALTNVLCSHPQISGYGETHVAYDDGSAPGRVLVNLALRRAFHPRRRYFADKLLHNHLDDGVPDGFFDARALFVLRAPGPALRSITALAARTGMTGVEDAHGAARYYCARLERLTFLWDRFAPQRRFGLTAEALLAEPDARIGEIGAWLDLHPRLENRYTPHAATQRGGGGDPTRSAGLSRIEPGVSPPHPLDPSLPEAVRHRCQSLHDALAARFDEARS